MRSMIATYLPQSLTPEKIVQEFLKSEKRLTWTGLFLEHFSHAEIFLVGGTVRDTLLGKVPKDIDLMVRGVAPADLEMWLRKNGACEFVGRFGTFKFIPHGQGGIEPLDISLPRVEYIGEHHHGGRRDMEVRFDHTLEAEDDLARRDFTINAIAYNFRTGRIIDPFGGLTDLKLKMIRSVLSPKNRFKEDATRILRGLRLASQLLFGIENETWEAMKHDLHLLEKTFRDDDGRAIFVVPREAVGKEFLLGFVEHPVHTFELWAEAGALHLYMPELLILEGNEQDHKLARKLTLNILHLLQKKSFLHDYSQKNLSLTALLAGLFAFTDIEAGQAKRICVQLYFHQFPNNHHAFVDCQQLYWLLDNLFLFEKISPNELTPAEFERNFMNNRGEDLLLLMQAFYTASGIHSPARERVLQAKRIRVKMLDLYLMAGAGQKLPQLISGSDLKALGINEGPIYREIFEDIRNKQLLGELTEKKGAIEFIKRQYKAA
jgi:tRNA nucleotidyltransferase/poly(A) polymerase